MHLSSPKLKESVQFFPIENNMFHVYDSETSRHFKMGEQEVAWLRFFDGQTNLDTLRGKIPLEYFDKFVAHIVRIKLLEGPTTREKRSILKIKLINIDPTKVIDRMGVFPIYYRHFLEWISFPVFILNILAIILLVPQAGRIRETLQFNTYTVVFYLVAIMLTGIMHEGSHALVARSFKVQVPKIGAMLFMLHPSFYADVSAINLLSHRGQRVMVLIAGVLGNNLLMFIGVILTFLPLGAMGQQFALLFIAINFVLMFVNLIPFVEFDGYFIFQELLGEPRFARNAIINQLSQQPKQLEYTMYFHVSQLFQFVMISSALVLLRNGVLMVWDSSTVDVLFLAMIIASYPAILLYRIKSAR
jgi:putative peptide zinc metalloprotease protein